VEQLYPVGLVLKGKRCVVVGGGQVAARKARSFVETGASVAVISPEICAELGSLEGVETFRREFTGTDLDGTFLVVGATDSIEVNSQVAAEAERRGILVNIVDEPALCNFYVSATVNRGDLCIGISTGGTSPALAKKLREELELRYGAEYEVLTRLLGEYREKVRRSVNDTAKRAAILTRLAGAGLETVIRDSGEPAARRRIEEIISEACR